MLAKEKRRESFDGCEGACVCRNHSLSFSKFYCFHCTMVLCFCKVTSSLWDSWLLLWSLCTFACLRTTEVTTYYSCTLGEMHYSQKRHQTAPFSPLDLKNLPCTCSCYGHLWSHQQHVRCSPSVLFLICHASLTDNYPVYPGTCVHALAPKI